MAEPRRSSRVAKPALTAAAAGSQASKLIQDGWNAFSAAEGEGGDGEESCTVKLYYGAGGSCEVCGATGQGHGHAEMDAIWKLFMDVCGGDIEKFRKYLGTLKIECEDKPCCRRCSAILGLLKAAATAGTKKTSKNMGSTEWSLVPDLRRLLEGLLGHPDAVLSELGSH